VIKNQPNLKKMRTNYLWGILLISFITQAQTEIVGTVIDANYQPVPGTTIIVEETDISVVCDFNGVFKFYTIKDFPITVTATGTGFEPTSFTLDNKESPAIITLKKLNLLDEIVISASRTPERVFESPVSIENFGLRQIKNTPSADFYSGLESLKGVDFNTISVVLKTINTRGFSNFVNTRFVQFVDGMDTSPPALNFVAGNLTGLSELDVKSIEIIPGTSSALYGANTFNGALFMKSKSPFEYQGISSYYRGGVTSQEVAKTNYFQDLGVRMAKAFSKKIAGKFNVAYANGKDWLAGDDTDILSRGVDRSAPDYNGTNIYGDEVGIPLASLVPPLLEAGVLQPEQAAILRDITVTRTGYREAVLQNNQFYSFKFDTSLHYRPFENDLEIIYNGRFNRGNSLLSNATRTALRDFTVIQNKLEVRNDNFFVQGYITQDDAGDTYDMLFTALNINNAWKDNGTWASEYALGYLNFLGTLGEEQAHIRAREIADQGRLEPGTAEFDEAFERVTSTADFTNGSRFVDKSKFTHFNGNYNLNHLINGFADIQVGGSFRKFRLNSLGTFLTDQPDDPIKYSEFGIYLQTQKQFFNNRLKLTGSVRYDKSQLFEGNISPRFAIGYTAGKEKNHNLRASAQTGFRNPTAQDLFGGNDNGLIFLTGSALTNLDRVALTLPLRSNPEVEVTITPRQAYENSFSLSSVRAGAPQKSNLKPVEPERITSFEVGYRAKVNKVVFDISGYYNVYRNFIAYKDVVVPLYGSVDQAVAMTDLTAFGALQNRDIKLFTASTNSSVEINSLGFLAGITGNVFGL